MRDVPVRSGKASLWSSPTGGRSSASRLGGWLISGPPEVLQLDTLGDLDLLAVCVEPVRHKPLGTSVKNVEMLFVGASHAADGEDVLPARSSHPVGPGLLGTRVDDQDADQQDRSRRR